MVQKTLPIQEQKPTRGKLSKITRTGLTVDEKYEKEFLSDIEKMQDTDTLRLNQELLINTKEYNEKLVSRITRSKEDMSSLVEKTKNEILEHKQTFEKLKKNISNERNNEID